MELTPSEQDRLLIFTAAQLAQSRRDRGLKLNHPEAVALICHAVIEAARDGVTHAQALAIGQTAVRSDELLPGVASMLFGVAVEAVFDDGRRLVVVDLPSSDVDVPGHVTRLQPTPTPESTDVVSVDVHNDSSVQISVTTHMHFFEVNPRLRFDREQAYGRHLDIPAGEHVDFPSGSTVTVNLVPITGERVIIGFAGLVDGPLDAPGAKEQAMAKAKALGYLDGGAS